MLDNKMLWGLRAAVLLIALGVVWPGFDSIPELIFDESHYVPAARDILSLSSNRNPEHPLFAKELIGLGIHVFGDTAFGWRLPGILISALGVLACFEIAYRLFRSPSLASLTAALVLTNIMFVVQARTAMLDTYAYPLFALSIAALIISAQSPSAVRARVWLVVGGVVLGLATGAKWTVGIYAVLALLFLCGQRTYAALQMKAPVWQALFGTRFRSWKGLSLFGAGLLFGLPAILAYLATFLPTYFLTQDSVTGPFGLIGFHAYMLDLQTAPLSDNPYESEWWSWPLLLEPIWYYFSEAPGNTHRAIFYVGNPVIIWGGMLALVACLIEGIRRSRPVPIYVAFAFLGSWLIFAILPKQIGFLFYFHGSAMLLCFVIPGAVSLIPKGKPRNFTIAGTALLAFALFLFFLPVIYAIPMPQDQWLRYIWLPGWA